MFRKVLTTALVGALLCGATLEAAELSVGNVAMPSNSTATVVVSGNIAAESTFGVNIQVEILSRVGSTGTVMFTAAPPVDITQWGDPWPGVGTFSSYDTDMTGSLLLNGSVDDNGTFVPGPVTFSGALVGFPIIASADAGGVWDVVLSTSAGDSTWEGVVTTLVAGTIAVSPPVGLAVNTFAIPPGGTNDVVVSGTVDNRSTFGVTVLVELVPRAGSVGTLTFTVAPPVDVFQIGDPWPGVGTFTTYDTNSTGSVMLNGCVDDNGSYIPGLLNFSGDLAGFPVTASANADGVWDVTLDTSGGPSYWEELPTALMGGTITVMADACVTNGDCDDDNTCTADVCNAGLCEYTTVIGACDDGDWCTENDTCQGTVCVATPVDCSGLDDQCAVGTCNPATGDCEAVPINEGQPCDDGDLCMENDVCTVGVCAGSAIDCSSLDDACNVGTCNPLTGACQKTPANEGGACSDDNSCTQNDACAQGVCRGTLIPGCTTCSSAADCNDANPCTDDTCPTGACVYTYNSSPCNDSRACTANDTCNNGVCTGTAIPGCKECRFNLDCNDSNPCTTDVCNKPGGVSWGACQYTNNTLPCDDANRCTLNDTCSGGVCVGTPVDCSALNDTCNLGVCNPANGACQAQPTNEGGPCDDGFYCTEGDMCTGGVCSGTLTAPPTVNLAWAPVTQTVNKGDIVQVSLVALSGTCIDQPTGALEVILNWNPAVLQLLGNVDNGPFYWFFSGFPDDSGLDGLNSPFGEVPGNDGNALYQAVASFQWGADVAPAGMIVTTFEFRALDGILSTQVTVPPTAGMYTRTRVLGAGSTQGLDITGTLGTSTVRIIECSGSAECNDGNLCTTDACNSGVCGYTNNTLPCNDGLFCTTTDTCGGGTCVGGSNPCSAPLYCSESLDQCVQCLQTTHCNDANVCTTDTCLATGACQYTNNTLGCNDGLFCTTTDRCSGGACVGTGARCTVAPNDVCDEANDRCVDCLTNGDCNDGNVCTTDTCNASNVCQNVANTAPCSDGLFCTSNDTCSNKVCVGGANPCTAPMYCSETLDACVQCLTDAHCDDGNVCTTDSCLFGTCSRPNNTVPCNDGVFCNGNDTCSGGSCSVHAGNPCSGAAPLCDEPNDRCVQCFTLADCAPETVACTEDRCDNGNCVHEPKNAACDDGVFCNGPEFCHATLGCRPGTPPCDDPALCNEDNDSCGCQEPAAVGEGSRYLAVTPRPGATPVALRVTGVDADVACVVLYVQANGTLAATPVYRAPGGGGWGTVHVRGMQIIPDRDYAVQTQCDTGQGTGLSTAASATTWRWADANNSGGLVDFQDISLIVDRFRGLPTTSLYSADQWGTAANPCLPQLAIDFNDITSAVEGFRQIPYHCSDPCP